MTNSLIEALKDAALLVHDPKVRSQVGWMLADVEEISTEVLTVGSARRSLRDVRCRVGEGGAALVADRASVGDPEKTTVMLSLSTLRNLVVSLCEKSAQMNALTSPAEFLSGLSPVTGEAATDFTVEFKNLTPNEPDDQHSNLDLEL